MRSTGRTNAGSVFARVLQRARARILLQTAEALQASASTRKNEVRQTGHTPFEPGAQTSPSRRRWP
eukprot:4835693-Pyramimonas_sp.AAC.1